MLEEKYLSVLGADSKGQLLAELVRFTRQLGFSTVSATVVLDQPPGVDPKFFWLENVPDAYRDTFSDPRSGKLDPVVRQSIHPTCRFPSRRPHAICTTHRRSSLASTSTRRC